MKIRKQDSDSPTDSLSLRNLFLSILAGLSLLTAVSCRNDMNYIKMFVSEEEMPSQTARNFDVLFTDSGKLKVAFKSPLVNRFDNKPEEGVYYEFKEGLLIEFYNDQGIVESTLTSKYGKYWLDKDLGYASDSVVGKNLIKGDELNTEELYWNKEKQILYSNVFTKITNEEGVFYGEKGFESDQDFENYKLIGSRGTVNVKDEDFPK
ncbi:MAG: LPS export ABC transporter periplasmic protein LptC [Bacteroidales bacterium]|nr:LPS export ABC transporter periplasmic protein LptC [Bacteroidales bacterium]